ncbi:MAG: phosphopyruvate hydratase [Candidatus Latescibacteria bacterium]|nr:phosphopyruvate hydratase [Candidatus Latescibacterota bacterium]
MTHCNSSQIDKLLAREILDSRGNPTIEVDCILESGIIGRAGVPSGASTGIFEALELRDGDKKRYLGKGVLKAVRNVTELIAPVTKGMDALDQKAVDNKLIELDGTANKSNLGSNAILGVSMAVARAGAEHLQIPLYKHLGGIRGLTLPVPMLNVINGGVHAPNNLDVQEYMIVPASKFSFAEMLRISSEVYHSLKKNLAGKNRTTAIGDEGGFAADFESNEEPFQIILESIEQAGYEPGKDMFLAIDAAASEFFQDGKYHLKLDKHVLESKDLVEIYARWIDNYPIVSIEDGFSQDDWQGWQEFTRALGDKIQIVGDDIFVTNLKRLADGIEQGVANAILIKLNQIGTVSETLACIEYAKTNKYKIVISHRSGETEDTFIADLAVATNAGQIKTGAPARGERICKYNRLLRIEQELQLGKG